MESYLKTECQKEIAMECPICGTEKIDDFICHRCGSVYDEDFLDEEREENRKEAMQKLSEYREDKTAKYDTQFDLAFYCFLALAFIDLFVGALVSHSLGMRLLIYLGFVSPSSLFFFLIIEKIQKLRRKTYQESEEEFFREYPRYRPYQ